MTGKPDSIQVTINDKEHVCEVTIVIKEYTRNNLRQIVGELAHIAEEEKCKFEVKSI